MAAIAPAGATGMNCAAMTSEFVWPRMFRILAEISTFSSETDIWTKERREEREEGEEEGD